MQENNSDLNNDTQPVPKEKDLKKVGQTGQTAQPQQSPQEGNIQQPPGNIAGPLSGISPQGIQQVASIERKSQEQKEQQGKGATQVQTPTKEDPVKEKVVVVKKKAGIFNFTTCCKGW